MEITKTEKARIKASIKKIVFKSVGNPVIGYKITDVDNGGYSSSYIDVADFKRHQECLLNRLMEVWEII